MISIQSLKSSRACKRNNVRPVGKALYRLLFVFVAWFPMGYVGLSHAQGTEKVPKQNKVSTKDVNWALRTMDHRPNESMETLQQGLEMYRSKKDTLRCIRCLIAITDIERFRGNYNTAFEKLWDALLLAEKKKHLLSQVKINRNLGILYSIYNKDSMAMVHFRTSLLINKTMPEPDKEKRSQALSTFFSMASVYKDHGEYEKALVYLDSCEVMRPNNDLNFVNTDRGYIYTQQGKFTKAEKYLRAAQAFFERKNDRYLVACYSNIADLKLAQSKPDSAVYYYTKSLELMDLKNAYLEYKPDVLRKLAALYLKQNKHAKAYALLLESVVVSDSLFNARSNRNSQLFVIKNKYKEALAKQERLVQQQQERLSEQEKIQLRLKYALVLILVLIGAAALFFRMKERNKQIRLTQKMEKEKSDAVLEARKKELTAYALQMIEKERGISELLDNVKKNKPAEYAALKHKYTKQNSNLWEEFHLRFIDLNSSFYEQVRQKHPNLSPTELKHCALIKLNFDSSEMSKILNISLQSVHTSRYRIRKKLNLEHGESLSHYIGQF